MNNLQKLFDLAQQTSLKAYAPYSNFHVGAAILSKSGNFYCGCNVENVSYPVGCCAETGAISSMIAGGDKTIRAIFIYASSKELISPCGACRQRIAEFADSDTLIYAANNDGIQQTFTISELLPNSFKEIN